MAGNDPNNPQGMPGMMPGMMPGQMPGMMPGQMPGMMPGQMMPGQMPGMMPGYGGNPMMQMMQMMQMMMGGAPAMPMMDPSAMPFAMGNVGQDADSGLDADIIRPATLTELIREQKPMPTGSVLDYLCLSSDAQHALGGLPMGCTITFVGPPGKGKTRTSLATLLRVAATGTKVAFVVAEEGFHNAEGSGRDDLCSRMVKIGMQVCGMDEATLREKALANVYVLESQYHKGQTWDDFIAKYRYLVEKEQIGFVVIDSLNMLDPTKNRTADNLSALKTYNHEKGVTCVCIGQIRDTGLPVGGEALMHTADAVFLIEEMGLGSKEMAEQWGGKYRDKIDVIRAVKSVTTPTFPHMVRVAQEAGTGVLVAHEAQPAEYALPSLAG
ncbi:MAG: AAA family ATPase [Alphaproteobacteria bacterium]|nr:AAA family ATPase [Alphaproteobacteria bacterium]